MKKYPFPRAFDGAKFAARYNLQTVRIGSTPDFWADDEFIYIHDGVEIKDDPPIFEAPDIPKESLYKRIETSNLNPPQLKAILLELAKGR